MKIILIVGIFVLASVLAFGISIGVGGGFNIIGYLGIPLLINYPCTTLSANLVFPLSNQFALTGNFESLSLPSIFTLAGVSGSLFIIVGGLRYTYGLPSNSVRTFVGFDGGLLSGSLGYSQQVVTGSSIVVGPNMGMTIQLSSMLLIYVEGAVRMEVGSSNTAGVSLDDINAGLNLNF